MKHVVITGSTRGIGRGLARAFLDLGCAVTISARHPAGVAESVERLASQHGPQRLHGQPCDVTDPDQVQALWDAARERWGQVDIWINNAGISHTRADFWQMRPEQMKAVLDTNLLGTMYGSQVALRGMMAQSFGGLYNLEGFGSDDRMMPGLTLYGTTKRAVRYLTRSLVREARGTPVIVGVLSPGMVVTDLLVGEFADHPERWESARRVFNILADRVDTVTPWLAREVLANRRTDARIAWLNGPKVAWRFITAGLRKRELFD